jgi:hypothetical protein
VGVDAVLVGGGAEVVLVGGFDVLVGGGALVVLVGGWDVVVEVALQPTASMLLKTSKISAINNSFFMLSITSSFPIGFARLKGV